MRVKSRFVTVIFIKMNKKKRFSVPPFFLLCRCVERIETGSNRREEKRRRRGGGGGGEGGRWFFFHERGVYKNCVTTANLKNRESFSTMVLREMKAWRFSSCYRFARTKGSDTCCIRQGFFSRNERFFWETPVTRGYAIVVITIATTCMVVVFC